MSKRILITPLDWGLGHATRCIPIIRELQNRGCQVFMASSGRAFDLLKLEFPALTCFELAGYNPFYPANGNMTFSMSTQVKKFMQTIAKEHEQVQKIVHYNKIDIIISDNRYGCYHTAIPSIFITHQLTIQMPFWLKWVEPILNFYNHQKISNFTECWVPAPIQSFIPKLVKSNAKLKVRHIGYLSRFEKKTLPLSYAICVICSGPEPQRTEFEKLLTKELKTGKQTAILVRGKPETPTKQFKNTDTLTICNYLDSEELNIAIEQSEIIISRPGYSTVMDLAKLQKKAIFIPTPGQTEQEYVADVLMKQQVALSVKQSEFNLQTALINAKELNGFSTFGNDNSLLQKALDSIL